MIFAIIFGIILSFIIRRGKLDLNAILSILMAVWAEFGAVMWNSVGENNYSGLPSFFQADSSYESVSRSAFLAASLALAITSLITAKFSAATSTMPLKRQILSPTLFSLASFVALVIWLIGNGPSIFGSRTYLSADGLQFVYQATNIAFPLLGFYCLIASARSASFVDSKISIFALSFAQGFLWLIFCLASGSRTAVFIIIGLCFITFERFKHGRKKSRIRFSFTLVVVVFIGILFSFAAFSVTYKARVGLFGLRDILSGEFVNLITFSPSVNDWVFQFQSVLSSVLSAFPITEMSSQLRASPQDVLLALNPLPAGFLGYSASSKDLILPWLPVSTIGQVIASFGIVGVIALYLSLFLLVHYCLVQMRSRGLRLESLALQAFSAVVLLVSLQYPLRMTSRLMSFILILALFLAVRNRSAQRRASASTSVI